MCNFDLLNPPNKPTIFRLENGNIAVAQSRAARKAPKIHQVSLIFYASHFLHWFDFYFLEIILKMSFTAKNQFHAKIMGSLSYSRVIIRQFVDKSRGDLVKNPLVLRFCSAADSLIPNIFKLKNGSFLG